MTIDLEKMKKKLASSETNGKSDKKDNGYFKPQLGDQEVRFLPSEDGDPFKEFFFHYGLGETFLCPKKNYNEKCPACEYAFELWSDKTDASKKQAKELFSKQRFFSNVIVRGKEAEGPKPYGYGKKTYQQLLKLVTDPEYGDVTDVESGYDFKLSYEAAKGDGAFPTTTLLPKRQPSVLAKTKKEIKELLDKIKPVEGLMVKKTPAEVLITLNAHLDDPFDDSKSEKKKYGNNNEEVGSVDAAINELLAE